MYSSVDPKTVVMCFSPLDIYRLETFPASWARIKVVQKTNQPPFFNRRREIKDLTEHFSRKGTELTLITGPPDSGKTLLLTEVLKMCEREKQHSWFHIDFICVHPQNSISHRLYFVVYCSKLSARIDELAVSSEVCSWLMRARKQLSVVAS